MIGDEVDHPASRSLPLNPGSHAQQLRMRPGPRPRRVQHSHAQLTANVVHVVLVIALADRPRDLPPLDDLHSVVLVVVGVPFALHASAYVKGELDLRAWQTRQAELINSGRATTVSRRYR
eukprot:132288-Chlamydomonas_euryale.AAC.5